MSRRAKPFPDCKDVEGAIDCEIIQLRKESAGLYYLSLLVDKSVTVESSKEYKLRFKGDQLDFPDNYGNIEITNDGKNFVKLWAKRISKNIEGIAVYSCS